MSHNRSVCRRATIWRIRPTGNLYLQYYVVNPVTTPLYWGEIQSQEKSWNWRKNLKQNVKTASVSSLPLPPTQYPTSVASPDALGGTRQPDLGSFPGVPPAPSWCVSGCKRPIGQDNVASDCTACSRVCGWLPIPLFPRLSLAAVLMIADLRLADCNDWEAIDGKCCGSVLYSLSYVRKHSYWWSHLPYTFLCDCNRASLDAWMLSSSWPILIRCLQPQTSCLHVWHMTIVAPEPRLSLPG